MPDVVCKCGNYVRAYVPPGTKVACYQCGEVLTMPGDPSESPKHPARRLSPFLMFTGLILATVLCAGGIWIWSQGDTWTQTNPIEAHGAEMPSKPSPEESQVVSSIAEDQAKWSKALNWSTSFEKIPRGDELKEKAFRISSLRTLAYPSEFWDRLGTESKAGTSTKDDQNSIAKFLISLGMDTDIGSRRFGGNKWDVLGVHQSQEEIGVLIRYYRESASAVLDRDGAWINGCCSLIGHQAFANACPKIFQSAAPAVASENPLPNVTDEKSLLQKYYFTPAFGYLILVFQPQSDGSSPFVWRDLIPLPGEVAIHRASALGAESDPDYGKSMEVNLFVDMFGEYEANSDESLASLLMANAQNRDMGFPLHSLRIAEQIQQVRARKLIEIALGVLRDTNLLGQRMLRFKKDYPEDFGCDALLISLWSDQQQRSRSGASYEDLGRVLVDASQRLYMKTSDPLLLEIKSRIYDAYGRRPEAHKAIDEAEELGLKSFYLLESRIQECLESQDKERLLSYLVQLNDYLGDQPEWVLDPEICELWRQRLESHREESTL